MSRESGGARAASTRSAVRARRILVAAAAFVTGLAGASVAHAQCSVDSDCGISNSCITHICDFGVCRALQSGCDDGIACTVDVCDAVAGCTYQPVDAACDDGSACTADFCSPSLGCQHQGIACDYQGECIDVGCDPAIGCTATAVVCNDGIACTVDSCDFFAGCQFTPDDAVCDDGLGCTVDVCGVDTGCASTATPRQGCTTGWGKTVLAVTETKPGKEKLSLSVKKGPALLPESFGDPVSGSTGYALCLFDQAGTLAGALEVGRAGDTCGTRPCWKGKATGWAYKDAEAAADGVLTLKLGAGDAGKSSIKLKGKNNAAKGQTALPVGITSALAGATAVTVQLSGTDVPECFETRVDQLKKQTPELLKAVGAAP